MTSNGTSTRVPPHNLQAEESLLGAMLLSRHVCDSVVGVLEPGAFYKPNHGLVFDAIEKLHDAEQPIDIETVSDVLQRAGILDEVGGRGALVNLQANTPATGNSARYVKIVQDHATLRALIHYAGEISADAFALPDDLTGLRRRTEDMLELLDRATAKRSARSLAEVLDRWTENMNQRALGERSAISTGFTDLDTALGGGLHPGQLVVLCGRTSMGKTAMAGSLATNIGSSDTPVLVSSIEMGELELADRWVAGAAHVPLSTIRNGTLNLDDWGRIDKSLVALAGQPIWIDDHDEITVSYLRGLARALPTPPAVIIVDYLQLLRPAARFDNRQEAVADISSSLKKLARRLEIPIVALAQLNRSAETRSDKRPMLSDLRESGSIENDADVVIGLYRDKYYKPSNTDDEIEAIIMKQRSGPLTTVRLQFAAEVSAVLNREAF